MNKKLKHKLYKINVNKINSTNYEGLKNNFKHTKLIKIINNKKKKQKQSNKTQITTLPENQQIKTTTTQKNYN